MNPQFRPGMQAPLGNQNFPGGMNVPPAQFNSMQMPMPQFGQQPPVNQMGGQMGPQIGQMGGQFNAQMGMNRPNPKPTVPPARNTANWYLTNLWCVLLIDYNIIIKI